MIAATDASRDPVANTELRKETGDRVRRHGGLTPHLPSGAHTSDAANSFPDSDQTGENLNSPTLIATDIAQSYSSLQALRPESQG